MAENANKTKRKKVKLIIWENTKDTQTYCSSYAAVSGIVDMMKQFEFSLECYIRLSSVHASDPWNVGYKLDFLPKITIRNFKAD